MYIMHGRHTGYAEGAVQRTYSGNVQPNSGSKWILSGCIPIITEMPFQECLDQGYNLWAYGGRLIDYVPIDSREFGHLMPPALGASIPIAAISHHCCDSSYIEYGRVEFDCQTASSGLSFILYGFTTNLANCISANDQTFPLTYTPGSVDVSGNAQWVGSFGARGGTLTVKLSCQSGTESFLPTYSPPSYRVEYYGCASGSQILFPSCVEPFNIDLLNGPDMGICCDCLDTDTTAEVSVYVTGTCQPTIYSRHIGYAKTGEPLMVYDKCSEAPLQEIGCATTQCGLTAVFTAIDPECNCLNGTYPLTFDNEHWEFNGTACASSIGMQLTCTEVEDGNTELVLSFFCGADNVGSTSITIPSYEMEDLDVTLTLCLTWEGEVTCLTCSYLYDEMALTWLLETDDCVFPDCICPDPPVTPGSPGEIIVFECEGESEPPCCVGCISVRITR